MYSLCVSCHHFAMRCTIDNYRTKLNRQGSLWISVCVCVCVRVRVRVRVCVCVCNIVEWRIVSLRVLSDLALLLLSQEELEEDGGERSCSSNAMLLNLISEALLPQ